MENKAELSLIEIELVSAGNDINWAAVGTGVGSVAVGIAIAATPVGWVGAAGATLFSFLGGFSIGTGVSGAVEAAVEEATATRINKT